MAKLQLCAGGDVLQLRKPCGSVVTFQKLFSIRGNVVSNTSYKDWVCQPSFETNKPFLTSCQSPPTISHPKEYKAAMVEQTHEANHYVHCYHIINCFLLLLLRLKDMCNVKKEKNEKRFLKLTMTIFELQFRRFWWNVRSSLRSMGLWTGSTGCRGSPPTSSGSGKHTTCACCCSTNNSRKSDDAVPGRIQYETSDDAYYLLILWSYVLS